MMFALGLSILFALAVGIITARNRRAEAVILPLLDIFQSIPILGFFPFVIIGIYGLMPNMTGANLAVIILIFSSMSWNIAFGVYEAVKAIPQDHADPLDISNASGWQGTKPLFIPASMSRIAYNTQTSWAVGLFFLVASEIIAVGKTKINIAYGKTIVIATSSGDYLTLALAVASMTVLIVAFNLTVWRRIYHNVTKRYTYNR